MPEIGSALYGNGPLSTVWCVGNGMLKSMRQNSRLRRQAASTNIEELCEVVVKMSTEGLPADAWKHSVLLLGFHQIYVLQLQAFRDRLVNLYDSLKCHVPMEIKAIDLPRETRPGRRQGIDILVAMNQTDDFGDLCMNYSGLMDSMDYIEAPRHVLESSGKVTPSSDIECVTLWESHYMSQNWNEVDDEAVLQALGSSQTVSKESDITMMDEVMMPELQIQQHDPENYSFGDFDEDCESNVESGPTLSLEGVSDRQLNEEETVEFGALDYDMDTDVVTLPDEKVNRVVMSPMNMRKRDAEDGPGYKEYKPRRKRPRGYFSKKDRVTAIPHEEIEQRMSVPSTPTKGIESQMESGLVILSPSPAKRIPDPSSPMKFFGVMGVLFGRSHGQRLAQMASEIREMTPSHDVRRNLFSSWDKSLEKEVIRAESHEAIETMKEAQSLIAPLPGSCRVNSGVGLSTRGEGGLGSSAEELSLLKELLESPTRCSSDTESITHMDSAVVVGEAIDSPPHYQSSDENSVEHLPENQVEPIQPADPEAWSEQFKIFQQVFPPLSTSKLRAGTELGQLLKFQQEKKIVMVQDIFYGPLKVKRLEVE